MKATRQAVLDYARESRGVLPEFPWTSYPDYAVLRHRESGKWFGVIMNVKKSALHLEGGGTADILNVKCNPIFAGSLRLKKGFFPAYHMNKDNWISIMLDGGLDCAEVFALLDESYDLVSPKAKKQRKRSGKNFFEK